MAIEALIARYGLIALFLGSGIEGEAVVVTGGILAHQGLVSLSGAMIAATTGSCIIDQLWFFVGRHGRRYDWVRRLVAKPAFSRALDFLERYPVAFIFGFRFVYGMRTISPVAIGTSRVPVARFMLFNALAAAIWAPFFTWLGYAFGGIAGPWLRRFDENALYVVGAVVILAIPVAVIVARRRAVARAEPSPTDQPDCPVAP